MQNVKGSYCFTCDDDEDMTCSCRFDLTNCVIDYGSEVGGSSEYELRCDLFVPPEDVTHTSARASVGEEREDTLIGCARVSKSKHVDWLLALARVQGTADDVDNNLRCQQELG